MSHKFEKFQKIPLIISIIFLVFSCSVFYFIYRQTNSNNIMSEQIEEEWQNENNKQNDMKSLGKIIKMTTLERAELEQHFTKSSDAVPFLDMIENLAPSVGARAQVTLVEVSPDMQSLVVDVKALGSFESIYKFMTLLENSKYELEFVSVDIKKSNTDTSSGIVSKEWSGLFKIKLLSFVAN